VNPDIVEKLADKKNAEACKERFLIYPYFAVLLFVHFLYFPLHPFVRGTDTDSDPNPDPNPPYLFKRSKQKNILHLAH
jgi:hypothetical protein